MTLQKLWQALTPRRLFVIFLFLGVLVWAIHDANDSDMWWHLATGRLILNDRAIPKADPFSYTVHGTRWYTHEWLTEVGMYGLYLVGGKALLTGAAALIVALTFWLVYLQCSGRPYVAVFVTLAATLASAVTWGVRPQILTMAGLALFSLLLTLYRQGRRWPLVAFPLLIAFWVNLHAGFLLGVAFLGVNLVGDGLALVLGYTGSQTLSWARWRDLALSVVCTLPAAMVNPNGWAMLRYPFDTLTSSAMSENIQEWASPNFHNPGFWPFAVLLMAGTMFLIIDKRKSPEVADLLMFLGFALAGLHSSRHVSLFAVVAPPIISRAIPWNVPHIARPPKRWLLAVNWLLLLLALVGVGLRFQDVVAGDLEQETSFYPSAALEYIKSQGWEARRIYNSYNWGGYLVWHEIPVFIDGRADVYGDEFIQTYLTTRRTQPDWRQPLEDNAVEVILIEADGALSTLLLETAEWDRVFHDDVADVFVHSSAF